MIKTFSEYVFDMITKNYLIYNSCWEDPAIDRAALDIRRHDTLLTIASAGCNTLDYLLDEPKKIYAVDQNKQQIALLDLKITAIKNIEFEDFFKIFGLGRHDNFYSIYHTSLRPHLRPYSAKYWDKHLDVFTSAKIQNKTGLYFHGLSGKFARLFHLYLKFRPRLKAAIEQLMAAKSLGDQKKVYSEYVSPLLWKRHLFWLLSNQMILNLLGVPKSQSAEMTNESPNDVSRFIKDSIDFVFQNIYLKENYFWFLYLVGSYSKDCCPEYLKKHNFANLKSNLIDRVTIYDASLTDFLEKFDGKISKFILLDHMDWMSYKAKSKLEYQWQLILKRSTNNSRLIFRSADKWPEYLDEILIDENGNRLMEVLKFEPDLSHELSRFDRVHTYAGFHIAEITGDIECLRMT